MLGKSLFPENQNHFPLHVKALVRVPAVHRPLICRVCHQHTQDPHKLGQVHTRHLHDRLWPHRAFRVQSPTCTQPEVTSFVRGTGQAYPGVSGFSSTGCFYTVRWSFLRYAELLLTATAMPADTARKLQRGLKLGDKACPEVPLTHHVHPVPYSQLSCCRLTFKEQKKKNQANGGHRHGQKGHIPGDELLLLGSHCCLRLGSALPEGSSVRKSSAPISYKHPSGAFFRSHASVLYASRCTAQLNQGLKARMLGRKPTLEAQLC